MTAGGCDGHMVVLEETIYGTVDELRVDVAEFGLFDGDEPVDDAAKTRIAEKAHVLADLMQAVADHGRDEGVRELVKRIAEFVGSACARENLEALRAQLPREKAPLLHGYPASSSDPLEIINALLDLHATAERREQEQRQQNRAARAAQPAPDHAGALTADGSDAAPHAAPEPATERDPGWEF